MEEKKKTRSPAADRNMSIDAPIVRALPSSYYTRPPRCKRRLRSSGQPHAAAAPGDDVQSSRLTYTRLPKLS